MLKIEIQNTEQPIKINYEFSSDSTVEDIIYIFNSILSALQYVYKIKYDNK